MVHPRVIRPSFVRQDSRGTLVEVLNDAIGVLANRVRKEA